MTQLDKPSKLKRLLGHRMAYGEIIPPDTRVDPSGFPEAEFPVFCPQCDYELRGLPEQRCPECGRPFDRGRLLVEQYVNQGGLRKWRRVRRFTNWCFVLGFAGLGSLCVLSWLYPQFDPQLQARSIAYIRPTVFGVGVAAFGLLLISAILSLQAARAGKRKCLEVFTAIDRCDSSFRQAQSRKWLLWIGVALLSVIAWQVSGNTDLRRYYREQPLMVILPAVAFCIAVGGLLSGALWKRYREKDDNSKR